VEKNSSYVCWELNPDTSAVQPIVIPTEPFRLAFNNILTCRAVFRQRLGKRFPAVTDTHATIVVVLETCFLLCPCKEVIRKTIESRIVHLKRAAIRKGLEHGRREIAIVGAVTRKRLVTS
jgi:hypothetical protein